MQRAVWFALACAPLLAAAGDRTVHQYSAVAISPDGGTIASVENDDVASDGGAPLDRLVLRGRGGHAVEVTASCAARPGCHPSSPSWNADGSRLAFLVEQPGGGTTTIEAVGREGGRSRTLLSFDGPLVSLRFGPQDRLSVLATASAHKRSGRTAPGARLTGEIGTAFDEQRIAVLDGDRLRFVSPASLYVYEYDWRPDGHGFVATAAAGDGDSHWWVSRLYAFDMAGASRVLFAPGAREQLADPVVAPDDRSVAFIGGWMSDFGSTGGDAYALRLDGGAPVDLTQGARSTATSLDWHCATGLTAMSLAGGRVAVSRLAAGQAPRELWSGTDALEAGGWNLGLSCAGGHTAAIRQSFTAPPELVAGPIGSWTAVTHANAGLAWPAVARSVTWTDDGLTVQGWLLTPAGDAGQRRPMIVDVHGGPEAAATPRFPTRGIARDLLAAGYDVFEPNYRGSFGQGETFAAASIGDLGGGDWRDVLSGVDAAERTAPIDDGRLGITGGSYGGYMTMWAVTQTHRFKAGAADAGVSDWLSIEGEAPQAGSDEVNFGGSVYDDPAAYLRASPITHMRGVKTPVLVTVGERDLECPAPQSQEFYTALTVLGVPASFVVYKDEGHAFIREADRMDLRRRTVGWFDRWLGRPPHS